MSPAAPSGARGCVLTCTAWIAAGHWSAYHIDPRRLPSAGAWAMG